MKPLQSGFSLLTAIFLLVVVATIGAYMVTIGGTQQATSTLSVLGSRARFAASSGMEWATEYVTTNNACFAPNPTSFTVSGGAANGYTVAEACTDFPYTEGADSYHVFNLETTATRGTLGSADYVRRSLRASITTAP